MHRMILLASAFALAAPVAAQDMQSPPGGSEMPPPGQSQPPTSQPPASEPRTGTSGHSSPFGAHDTDHNGSLSRAEFTAMVRARAQGSPASEEDIAAAFQRADTDGDGEISGTEAGARQSSPQ